MTKKSRDRRVHLRFKTRQRRLITEIFEMDAFLEDYRKYPLTPQEVHIPLHWHKVMFEGQEFNQTTFNDVTYNLMTPPPELLNNNINNQ